MRKIVAERSQTILTRLLGGVALTMVAHSGFGLYVVLTKYLLRYLPSY